MFQVSPSQTDRLPSRDSIAQVSCKLRNAEYNPRKDVNKLFIRLFRPAASAHIWHTGAVNCCVKARALGLLFFLRASAHSSEWWGLLGNSC